MKKIQLCNINTVKERKLNEPMVISILIITSEHLSMENNKEINKGEADQWQTEHLMNLNKKTATLKNLKTKQN